ncbi:MAG: glycosyltransferase [Chitinophagaceae bacterium]|nr:MAG: glycosyltransferase [Chitinophagaceae bacterium]
MKRIYLAVTNDLSYDQRMQRICGSLAAAGYAVTLVGRKRPGSLPLADRPYRQRRLSCFFERGFLFYAEFNLRLLLFLLFRRFDALCAIDLDTALPCLWAGKLKGVILLFDAHELFTEMKEVRRRPRVHAVWTRVEAYAVPRFQYRYTVAAAVAEVLLEKYGSPFLVVRNMPLLQPPPPAPASPPFLLYQGAVNEGRGFEWLLPAMKRIPLPLVVCGDGNFMDELRRLIAQHGLEQKVDLRGMLPPDELRRITPLATIGVNFTEPEGLNQLLCLPNKFFDYVQAGVPQLTNDYLEYVRHNAEFEVALLVRDWSPEGIAAAALRLLDDKELYGRLRHNCLLARACWHWERESQKLLELYQSALPL